MIDKIEQNKSIIQIISLIIGILIVAGNLVYSSTVLSQNLSNDIERNRSSIERLEAKYDYQIQKLDNSKVNAELFKMMDDRLQRIENKLDNLSK